MTQLPARGGSREETQAAPSVFSLGGRRYYRVDEVARYFGVSDRTIYRLIDMGDLKAIRLRDCLRIPVEEIPEFEARRRDDFQV
ncbi:MAG: helix-turn-helix domain-containing protein [Deltaproteobacteria bacterium]|nr:helix-turn-helix domain-containing protein [Deltaproteobacteria bacterium]